MGYVLRPGLSYCLASGRATFLDVPGDRYFCLSRDAEGVFLDLADGIEPWCPSKREEVIRDLLVETLDDVRPAPCPGLFTSGLSLLDEQSEATRLVEWGRALFGLWRVSARLKNDGFDNLLASVTSRKRRIRRRPNAGRAAAIAAAFARTNYIVTAHDQCLIRSVAIAKRLTSADLAPDLVLGVKHDPFKAHCWVQLDGNLINDRYDVVRDFTPILVL